MTLIGSVPNRPLGTDPRSISALLTNFDYITAAIDGTLDGDNLSLATRRKLGLSDSTTARSGSSIIATQEAIAGAGYAVLTTPDRVSNIELSTPGIIFISVQVTITKTAGANGDTAGVQVYMDGFPVRSIFGTAPLSGVSSGLFIQTGLFNGWAPTSSAMVYSAANVDNGFTGTLSGNGNPSDTTSNGGHLGGAFVPVIADSGLHTVELRYAKSAGTMLVDHRRLYVMTQSL